MSKAEDKRTRASTLVALYMAMLAATETDIEAVRVLDSAARVVNSANPKLFPDDDSLSAAIAGQLLNMADDGSAAFTNACKAFADYFIQEIYVSIGREVAAFAPHSRQYELLRNSFHYAAQSEFVSVTQLAKSFLEATEGGNLSAARRVINDDIEAGRLKAQRVGKQYIIAPADAAAWLANPARGSRQ